MPSFPMYSDSLQSHSLLLMDELTWYLEKLKSAGIGGLRLTAEIRTKHDAMERLFQDLMSMDSSNGVDQRPPTVGSEPHGDSET